jgi:hypothetical protein
MRSDRYQSEGMPGVGVISAQPQPDRRKRDEGKGVGGEFVIAGCDPTALFDLVGPNVMERDAENPQDPLDRTLSPILHSALPASRP